MVSDEACESLSWWLEKDFMSDAQVIKLGTVQQDMLLDF